jgi:hypothetical protein
MKVARVALLAFALSVPGAMAHADTVAVGDTVNFGNGPGNIGGGEFIATINGGIDSFITFCLQRTESIDFSTAFVVGGISPYAMTDDAAHGGDVSGRDLLSSRTAWLYTQFRQGTLAGYDYVGAGHEASANALQSAFWWFENEIDTNPANAFVAAADAAVAGGWTGIGNVRVMNLYFPNGGEAQDQLTLVPEPTSVALFGIGLAFAARRLRSARRRLVA